MITLVVLSKMPEMGVEEREGMVILHQGEFNPRPNFNPRSDFPGLKSNYKCPKNWAFEFQRWKWFLPKVPKEVKKIILTTRIIRNTDMNIGAHFEYGEIIALAFYRHQIKEILKLLTFPYTYDRRLDMRTFVNKIEKFKFTYN